MEYFACGRHHALGYSYDQKKKKKESNNIKSRSFRINILVGKTCGHKTNKEKAEYSQWCMPWRKEQNKKGSGDS